MITVDTNILVRVLVDDPVQTHQVNQARHFAKKAGQLFVPQIVQIELVWILDTAYDVNKIEIISILKHLQDNEAFQLQNEEQYRAALQLFQSYSADFSDCLIYAESEVLNYEVVTFDKKFSRLPKVVLLER